MLRKREARGCNVCTSHFYSKRKGYKKIEYPCEIWWMVIPMSFVIVIIKLLL